MQESSDEIGPENSLQSFFFVGVGCIIAGASTPSSA